MIDLTDFTRGAKMPAEYLGNAKITINVINAVMRAFPNRFRFTSGFRSLSKNKSVNGVKNSFHLTGQAGDLVAKNGTYPKGEKQQISDLVASYGYEVILHDAGSGLHYHLEPMPTAKNKLVSMLPSKSDDIIKPLSISLLIVVLAAFIAKR